MATRTPRYKISPSGYGEYSMVLSSGALTGVAADGPVWSFRWGQSDYAAVIRRISIDLSVTTAYGTDQATEYGLYFATTFTAVDTGGTAATLTGRNGKLRTSMETTKITTGDMRIGTTDVITAGTRTLDTQPLAVATFQTDLLGSAYHRVWDFGGADDYEPIVLAYEEGVVLNNLVAMSATGVVKLRVGVTWAEVPTADL